MQPPDCELPFELMFDASNYALGVVLSQRIDKPSHVIAYASCTLDATQVNYTTTENELLAIVFALDKFKSYLFFSRYKSPPLPRPNSSKVELPSSIL